MDSKPTVSEILQRRMAAEEIDDFLDRILIEPYPANRFVLNSLVDAQRYTQQADCTQMDRDYLYRAVGDKLLEFAQTRADYKGSSTMLEDEFTRMRSALAILKHLPQDLIPQIEALIDQGETKFFPN